MNVTLVNTFLCWFSKVIIITCNKIWDTRLENTSVWLFYRYKSLQWVHELLILRPLEVFRSPPCILLVLNYYFMLTVVLEMPSYCSMQSLPIVAAGSLHKMRWGCGDGDTLCKWADSRVLYVDWVAPHISSWAHDINRSSHNTQLTQCGLHAIAYIPITANIFSIHSTQ